MNWIIKNSKLTIGIILIITGLLGIQLKNLIIDNDVNNFFPKDNYTYQRTKAIDDIYGSQVIMDVAITAKKASFLTKETIEVINNITKEIESLEYVNEVLSLTNTDFPGGSTEGMTVEKLISDTFSGSEKEIVELKNKLLDWPDMYRRLLYSDDFKSTQIITIIDHYIESDPLGKLYQEIKAITDKYSSNELEFSLAGNPVVNEVAKTFMYTDLTVLIPFVTLVILFSLFISFKRFAGTILPLITVIISTIWTVGIMAMLGFTFTVVTTCLPVLLIAVGSAFGIHIINHYYHELENETGDLTTEQHTNVILRAIRSVRKPVILAAVTTILGFLSILSSPVNPLKTFGLFSAIGVFIALVLSLIVIPSLLSLNKKPKGLITIDEEEIESSFLASLYTYFSKKTPRIIFITLILLGISFYGIKNINIESSLIKYFPKDSIIRTDNQLIVDKFSGTNSFTIEIRGNKPGDLTDPYILNKMDELSEFIKSNNPEVGKVLSFSDYIKRINKVMNYPIIESEVTEETFDVIDSMDNFSQEDNFFGDLFISDNNDEIIEPVTSIKSFTNKYNSKITYLEFFQLLEKVHQNNKSFDMSADELIREINREFNYNGASYNEIPTDHVKYGAVDNDELKNLISQYLLLYSGSLDQFADDALSPSSAKMIVYIKNNDTGTTAKIINDVNNFAENNFPNEYKVECSGVAALELSLTDMITNSQIISLVLALILVFIIISVSFKSPIAGLIGIVPLLIAIAINFGIMGIFHINLDMITALIASIAIGVGVDYTIHFLSTYHKERLNSEDLSVVSRNTIVTSGRGILINAISVAFGFLVLIFSNFIVLRYIGILVAIIMITSSLAALTILPILLKIIKPKFISKR